MSQVDLDTLVYSSFADIGKPEPFTDENGNGTWDAGEPLTDVNGNAQWDADMGKAGLGGPSDIVVYRLSYDWGLVTPMMRGVLGDSVHHVSSIAVRNEPYLRRHADGPPPPRRRLRRDTPRLLRGRVRAGPADPRAVQRRDGRVQPADPADPEAAERLLPARRPDRPRQDASTAQLGNIFLALDQVSSPSPSPRAARRS